MKKLIWGIGGIIVLLAATGGFAAGTALPVFHQANSAYTAGEYAQAIAGYKQLIAEGTASGAVYYNLGNAYVKTGQYGRAILNYERAGWYFPQDADLRANYEFAVGQLPHTPPTGTYPFGYSWLVHIGQQFGINRLTGWTVTWWWISCLFLGLQIVRVWNGTWPRYLLSLSVLCCVFSTLICAVRIYETQGSNRAVVVAASLDGKFAPSSQGETHLRLYEGAMVTVLEQSGGWVRIKTPDNKIAWAPQDAVARLADPAA